MLHTLAGRALGHSVIACSLRKTPPPNDIVKDFETSDVYSPVGTGGSVIAFINSETPLLNLSIPRIPRLLKGVKKEVAHFWAAVLHEWDDGITHQTRIMGLTIFNVEE